ncbi:hypothetical protein [Sinimarinibacterium flocculans]|uniref:Uncharacterized protein n=1 Tax=Sinimarinibacterium flocculans TaxID=985250 RepID=A0A318E5P2_9GAMM|nr:hypothetical protein [Sinimarinibacterium flocculans]PXV65813.1 hypothetical protein C8D93_109193 [Sinimarinibacterium flocculans]
MQQAAKNGSRITPPINVLIQDHPADTLDACANVLAFLIDAEDTRRVMNAAPMSSAADDGMSWIKMLVTDAIRYESDRATKARSVDAYRTA